MASQAKMLIFEGKMQENEAKMRLFKAVNKRAIIVDCYLTN